MILFVLLLTATLAVWGQTGVNFEALTFGEALSKAKAENKWVFVDCYTTWCGPCRLMTDSVFSQAKVGDFFNPRFVSVKLDMEKEEGKQFGKSYGVASYPTFFLIRPDSTLQHKITGAYRADEFLRLVKEGMEDTETLGSLEEKYRAGERDKAFLYRYLRTLHASNEWSKVPVVTDELLKMATDEEKVSEDYWFIFGDSQLSPADSKAFEYLKGQRDRKASCRERV